MRAADFNIDDGELARRTKNANCGVVWGFASVGVVFRWRRGGSAVHTAA